VALNTIPPSPRKGKTQIERVISWFSGEIIYTITLWMALKWVPDFWRMQHFLHVKPNLIQQLLMSETLLLREVL
jgi:hypothetical protein